MFFLSIKRETKKKRVRMTEGRIQIYFTTEELSLLATRHAYRDECYSLNENDYKWNRYKGQPIIIGTGFDIYFYVQLEPIKQHIERINMKWPSNKILILRMLNKQTYTNPRIARFMEEYNIRILSKEVFHPRCIEMPAEFHLSIKKLKEIIMATTGLPSRELPDIYNTIYNLPTYLPIDSDDSDDQDSNTSSENDHLP